MCFMGKVPVPTCRIPIVHAVLGVAGRRRVMLDRPSGLDRPAEGSRVEGELERAPELLAEVRNDAVECDGPVVVGGDYNVREDEPSMVMANWGLVDLGDAFAGHDTEESERDFHRVVEHRRSLPRREHCASIYAPQHNA